GGYGKKPVIKDLNFELNEGEIVGLIGLNGAGKSTTIKHILGLLQPTEGQLSISGTNIQDDVETYRRKLSYIPEAPVIYDELTLE
ncbi:ATP-binding cassette domain-containing protein, partial [Staphylococcus caprae]